MRDCILPLEEPLEEVDLALEFSELEMLDLSEPELERKEVLDIDDIELF